MAVSTHTLHNDALTTIVSRTTTIVSEHEEFISHPDQQSSNGVVHGVKKTLKDYWFPSRSHSGDDDGGYEDQEDEHEDHADSSLFKSNSVMRRAYDYWKSLTKDVEETAKQAVIKAKETRDEAAKEAKWAMFGYKREARERFEAAEEKYRQALATAEKAHEEALEKARSRWFQQSDCTQKEVGEKVEEVTHEKWDQFKAAVDSLAFNPPKYACNPTSQYWFSRQNPSADSGWDCREIWDHPSHHDHGHGVEKTLPKKHLPLEKVHDVLESLWKQAGLKAKTAPSFTSFEPTLKSTKDYYLHLLDRIGRNEQGAVEELDTFVEKVKAKLNEAKYHEEQTESWLTSQWNAVIDNAGESKLQYERAFKNAIKRIKDARTEAYTSFHDKLQESINAGRSNIHKVIKQGKSDKAKVRKTLHDASTAFTDTIKETENKIKSAPKNAYDLAVETFNKETAQLKSKLEHAAEVARKSGSSISHEASKSVSSITRGVSKSASSLSREASKSVSSISHNARKDASRKLSDAKASADAIKSRAASGYEHATASVSSMWGAATPFKPLAKAQNSCQQLLGDAKNNLFGEHDAHVVHHDMNSLYGALTALYFLCLARRIWLRRNCCFEGTSTKEVHGDLYVTKKGGRRHSRSHRESEEDSEDQAVHPHHNKHDDHGEHEEHGVATSHRGHQNEHKGHHHHHNSFDAVLKTFTSRVPMTMILLVLLELGGFTRVGLHTLFAGLVVSQLLNSGYFNNVMKQLGILDTALGETMMGRDARKIGSTLGWTIFGLAGAANAIKVLHDE
ncbi:hypothetical protein BGZ58_009459 [Dissophora ornata]|nr:hypothetical protein BGZ58_009459 [Dissophora ornata]